MSTAPARRRSPVPYAVALVVVLVAAGWFLRWWGPMNPAVHAYPSVSVGSGPLAAGAEVSVGLHLTNSSHSDVHVVALRLRAEHGAPLDGLRLIDTHGVPAAIAPGQTAVVGATLRNDRTCRVQGPVVLHGFGVVQVDLAARLRTASGRLMTITGGMRVAALCRIVAG